MTYKKALLLFCALMVSASVSCFNAGGAGRGEVRVTYLIHGGLGDCAITGIDELVVTALTLDLVVTARGFSPCDPNEPELVLTRVPTGHHYIFVDGNSRSGERLYSGHTADPVEIRSGRDNAPVRIALSEVYVPAPRPRVAGVNARLQQGE